MTYEVLAKNLRSAATSYRGVADRVGKAIEITHDEPASLGHVELAAWLTAVGEQCGKANQALIDGANARATDLETAATYYETADDNSATSFTMPLNGYDWSSPYGSGPFGTQPPVYGPYAPGYGPTGATGPTGSGG